MSAPDGMAWSLAFSVVGVVGVLVWLWLFDRFRRK
jgi:hypothetical protein